MMQPALIAAVDLGSNSFRLMVGRLESGDAGIRIQPVDSLKETVRLAAGLDADRNLTPTAQRRALDALRRFGERLRTFHPDTVRAVATSTLRVARNARQFLPGAEAALGFPIEVIGGREEARLIYIGAAHTLPADGRKRLVVDIGGGSTECIVGQDYDPILTESVTVGCVGLTARLFADGEVRRDAFRKAVLTARELFAPLARRYGEEGWQEAVGTSGTAKSLSAICAAQYGEHAVTRDGLARIERELLKAGHIDRLKLEGLRADRRPVLPGGLAILTAAFEEFGIQALTYASGALREGVLYDVVGRANPGDMRNVSVEQAMKRWGVSAVQALRVGDTAALLWRAIASGTEDEIAHGAALLRWSAALHEIGLAISHASHHRHGAYVIANADLPGFSRPEQALMSRLVLGHTGKLAKMCELVETEAEWRMLLALRLAVILHRRRDGGQAEGLALRADGNVLRLSADAGWLAAHPLTAFSLEAELTEWAKVGVFEQAIYETIEPARQAPSPAVGALAGVPHDAPLRSRKAT